MNCYMDRLQKQEQFSRDELIQFMDWLKQKNYYKLNDVDIVSCDAIPLHQDTLMKDVICHASEDELLAFLTYYVRMEYLSYEFNPTHYAVMHDILLRL